MQYTRIQYGLILTTTASRESAETIARTLLAENLAACINYFAVNSLYRWQGAIQQEPEWQLIIKTDLQLQNAIEARLRSIHAYEVPEFVVIPFQGGSEAYLQWLGQQVQTLS